MSDKPKQPSDHEVWNAAVEQAKKEPHEVLTYNKSAVREALRSSRERRGRAVPHWIKSVLP